MIAYEGSENYIFVSYAHKDSNRVIPIIEALDSAGFRIWYDSGIEVGSEWPEYIEDHLLNSSRVLVFMTPSCVASPNCRNEINLARAQRKEMLVVYLEPTELIKGMRLQLNSVQAINARLHPTVQDLTAALARAQILQCCNIGWDGKDNSAAEKSSAKKSRPTKLMGGNTETATMTFPALFPLLKRAFMFLEDGEWNSADEYCEKVLDQDPENAQAYVGKLMAELKVKKQEALKDCADPFDNSNNYQKAVRFADEKLKAALTGYIEHINTRNENARLDGIYTRAKNVMSAANTESTYKEAAARFESIREYQDSAALANECLKRAEEEKRKAEEEKRKCDELFKEYKAAIKNERSGVDKKAEANNKLSTLDKEHNNLVNLKNSWQGIEDELFSLNERMKPIKSEIASLTNERSNLGFFAGKRKREIAERIATLENNQQSLMGDIAILQKKKQGCNTLSEVESKINRIIQQIEEQKKAIEELSSARSSQTIRDELNALGLGKTLLQKFDSLQNIKAGKYITFGAYEQDNNTSNGKEDIEWLVLEVKDGKALLISKYALDCKKYNTSRADVTWETCTLRKWLNNDFINSAFSADEKAMIPTVTVSADKNPKYSTNPGNATQDQVFLLSITEANQYFSTYSAMQCNPTDYAVANRAYVDSDNGNCCWWLRSPGYDQNRAAGVFAGGGVDDGGNLVYLDISAVRPALWIDLNS